MIWKEVKTWSTNNGYKVDRQKIDETKNKYEYTWSKNDRAGVEYSTSDLVKTIYNELTSNKFVDHQNTYSPTEKNITDDLSY